MFAISTSFIAGVVQRIRNAPIKPLIQWKIKVTCSCCTSWVSSLSMAALSVSSPKSYDAGIAQSSNTLIQNIHVSTLLKTAILWTISEQTREQSGDQCGLCFSRKLHSLYLSGLWKRNSVDTLRRCDKSCWLRPAKLPWHAVGVAGMQNYLPIFSQKHIHLLRIQSVAASCRIGLPDSTCLLGQAALWTLETPRLNHIQIYEALRQTYSVLIVLCNRVSFMSCLT